MLFEGRQVELFLSSCTCSGVLSYEVLSYLVYEGVFVCEQLEMFSKRQDGDIKPCLRRMHLAVTAIREFLQAMNVYIKMTHLSQEAKEAFVKLQLQMAVTEDLRCLFVMLLHQFNPNCQSNQYLQDVIVTNHNLLLFLDRVNKLPEFKSTSSFTEHIKQFATVEIMHQYGLLLENIQDNGEFINDCVFTMMHHIGGDVRQVSTLFQPSILKCFTRIWESDFELCDDWSDLIEYVIHKFVNTPRQTAILPEVASMGKVQDSLSNNRNTEFSKEDSDNLCWHYCQSVKNEDTVGRIIELYAENGVTNKTTSGVHDCMQNISCADGLSDAELTVPNKIHFFIDHLQKAGKGHLVVWLQKALIEACYAKLRCSRTVVQSNGAAVIEPIPWVYTLMGQSIPLVTWNCEQKSAMKNITFSHLLHTLGFQLSTDSGNTFARIPNFWTPDFMFSMAEKLGPIDSCKLNSTSNWLNLVSQFKSAAFSIPPPTSSHHDSADK
uniref:Timeless C-terminal domain-containing protein n=1 Tax=Timema poppense TaxID=170557 RepID=A0A7R9CJM8_TIMPO|nr:unnamed protein product [Timema poppensis]